MTFIVLIAFQAMMNTDRIAIERVSSYIRVFFEEPRNDMHWSKLNKDEKHLDSYSKQYRNIGWYINMYASSILAVISFISMVVVYATRYNAADDIPLSVCVQIGVALLLCLVAIVVNTKYYDFKTGKSIIKALDDGIQEFYNTCYNSSIATQDGKANTNENK